MPIESLPTMKEIIKISPKIGYKKGEFIREAIRTFLAARRDLRIALACELYKEEEISLGRASEIAGVSYEEMKRILRSKKIKLKRGLKSIKKLKKKTKELLELAG